MPHSERRPKVVLMCGISGSGKTHHALRLESEGYVRVSVDAIVWRRHGPDFAALPSDELKQIFREGMAEAREETARLIDEGRDVVVDATMCKRAARDMMRRVCREHGVEPSVVCLRAPKELLWRRLSGRVGGSPDDLVVSREQLDRYCAGFEMPQPDETDVTYIDMNDTDA